MHRSLRLLPTLCVGATLSAAALAQEPSQSSSVAAFASRPTIESLEPEERRIWSEADDLDRRLRRQRLTIDEKSVVAYLQALIDKLYPELGGALRVKVIDEPEMNAFALPNGSVYVNLGLLARIENESQLATVLGHEGAHFAQRHGYQKRQTAKSGTAVALGAGVLLGPILGTVTSGAVLSSIFGFSREMEREADRIGYERLVQNGFDREQSARVFALIADEAKALDSKEQGRFASHPELVERINSFRELIDTSIGARIEATASDTFEHLMRPLRVVWLERALARAKYASVLYVLGREGAEARFPAHAPYYLGEAYRMRGQEGDAGRAIEAYRRAIAAAPAFGETYRALGTMHLKAGQKTEAREALERYLTLVPDSPHGRFVKQYLRQLEEKQ